jgi:F0F1-type ATP synthase membrane subunit b/b'
MPLSRKGAELKAQASEKVDQAKDKANELANDAKKKGEGRRISLLT